MSNDFEIGIRIKQRRKELGYTAEQVADLLGVAPSTVYRYENGEIANMGISSMKKLADVLHLAVSDILGMSEDPSQSLMMHEERLLAIYRQLNAEGQDKLLDYGKDLVNTGRYIKNDEIDMVGKKQA